jgi:hypothetical protein
MGSAYLIENGRKLRNRAYFNHVDANLDFSGRERSACRFRAWNAVKDSVGGGKGLVEPHKRQECKMQIAGANCRACGQEIVLSKDGKFCRRCNSFAHNGCEPSTTCSVCAERFESFEPPKPDPLWDAVPRSLRSNQWIGPILTTFLAGLAILLAIYLMMLA